MIMDVKDKIGSWQSNAYVYQTPKAYTNMKKIFGSEFFVILNSAGVNETININQVPPVSFFFLKGYTPLLLNYINILLGNLCVHQRL